MLKKTLFVLAAAAAVFAFSACSSMEYATTLNDQRLTVSPELTSLGHVNGEIWGLYLFDIALLTGSSVRPGSMVCFNDTVRVDNVVKMVTAESAKNLDSCTAILDMRSERNSFWIFPLLWIKSVQVSGNAVK
ncbi:MAG: hypothetical protein J6A21_12090 [Lentisphaeria bacterium]|nr:hypothetical protein [Lentisphaeria bacterium]